MRFIKFTAILVQGRASKWTFCYGGCDKSDDSDHPLLRLLASSLDNLQVFSVSEKFSDFKTSLLDTPAACQYIRWAILKEGGPPPVDVFPPP
jgi:hypothetical protein